MHKKFKFAVQLVGDDPDTGGSRMKMVYPTLYFPRPANPRAVRAAIKKFLRTKFGIETTKNDLHRFYKVGMRMMAAEKILRETMADKMEDITEEQLNAVAYKAQQRAEQHMRDKKGE